jgi:hypothetical protein
MVVERPQMNRGIDQEDYADLHDWTTHLER